MKSKIIFLLIGKKGSGKTYIGNLFDQHFGIKFIRVEDWAKRIKKERGVDHETYLIEVFELIENGIRDSLIRRDCLVFESTGLTDYFDNMLQSLKKDFHVRTIGIYADNGICLDRVKARDQTIHINVSDDQVSMINQKVKEKNFQTDFWIDNETKSEKELINDIQCILEYVLNK